MKRWFNALLLPLILSVSGCFRLSGDSWYQGPPERPAALLEYYAIPGTYSAHQEKIVERTEDYTRKKITISTHAGAIVLDLFECPERSDEIILLFPVLGGRNFFEEHMAKFFAGKGIDAAIINRNNEFKDPANFERLEVMIRNNVKRDRLALDFLEREYQKKTFGSFGISRGGINVAITAGVDERLKYNVLVLAGTDLVELFRNSTQRRIRNYVTTVAQTKNITEDQVFELLSEKLKSDPKYTAHLLDARNTLLILGAFDRTVPFPYGLELRDQIGRPETIILAADHFVGLLFTQTISLIPPRKDTGLFPFPYIEQEALSFFKRSFGKGYNWSLLPYRIVQLPFNIVAESLALIGGGIERLLGGPPKYGEDFVAPAPGPAQIKEEGIINGVEDPEAPPQNQTK